MPLLSHVFFSEAELERLNEYAKTKDMTVSAVIRHAVRVLDAMEQTPGAFEALNGLTQAKLGPIMKDSDAASAANSVDQCARPLASELFKGATDPGCICKGNWRAIVKESEPLIGKRFVNHQGVVFRFFGVVHGGDDYYYGMCSKEGGTHLLSCVGSIEGHGFKLLED